MPVIKSEIEPEKRQAIIDLLDKENLWEHIVMNYIVHVFRCPNPDLSVRNCAPTAKELNHIIDDVMSTERISK